MEGCTCPEYERLLLKTKSSEKVINLLREQLRDCEKAMSAERVAKERENEVNKVLEERLSKTDEKLKQTDEMLNKYVAGYTKATDIIQSVDRLTPIVKHNAYVELAKEIKNHYKKNISIHKAVDKAIEKLDKVNGLNKEK